MGDWTFRQVVEIVIFILVYGLIDSLIIKLFTNRPSRGTRRIIYMVGLFVAYFVFTSIAGLFNYEIQVFGNP